MLSAEQARIALDRERETMMFAYAYGATCGNDHPVYRVYRERIDRLRAVVMEHTAPSS